MPQQYTLIGIFFIISLVIGIAPIMLAWFFSPKKTNPQKVQVYESGNPTFGEAWIEFKPQYYMFGLAFVAFDVEVAFLFPFALAYDKLSLFAVIEAAIFLSLLGFSLVYVSS
jgi:NADH-quinone oxidoreductase subunit A